MENIVGAEVNRIYLEFKCCTKYHVGRRAFGMETPKKRGRPPKPKGEKQSFRLMVNITNAEGEKLREDAARLNLTPGQTLLMAWREWREG